jgi:glyoxylase-like metal-dependent hydrolase (beta-lactamase superfamily II)
MRTKLLRDMGLGGLALIAATITQVHADTDRSIEEILQPIQLTERVYYFYGSIEARAPINLGMNNNTGFVITDDGVVMVDSGPNYQVAERIAAAVASVTDQPITHVINLGSQDHRWLGNGWFLEHGAEIIALQRTAETQAIYGASHMNRSIRALGEEAMAGTEPAIATYPIDADVYQMEIGGVPFELMYVADAHFPGDIMLNLPGESVVFTGDVVYTERLLGIHPESNPLGKLANFRKLAQINPRIVVPGHGAATDMTIARRDAGDYLEVIVGEVQTGIENWETLDETVNRLAELPQFQHLLHFDAWHRVNINRTYLFIEAEQ